LATGAEAAKAPSVAKGFSAYLSPWRNDIGTNDAVRIAVRCNWRCNRTQNRLGYPPDIPRVEVNMQKLKRDSFRQEKKSAKSTKVRPRWSGAEVGILKRLYRTHSNAEIAKVLGRKVSSVVFKAHRLRLAKGVRRLREMGQENISKRWDNRRRKT
jgi:hypothetical protein